MEVMWCNVDDEETNVIGQVGHPYPNSDTNAHRFAETHTTNERGYQEDIEQVMRYCGYHWERRNPFRPGKHAIQAQVEKVESTDQKTEEYLNGYREGVLKGEAVA